jgi:hypothetical protein
MSEGSFYRLRPRTRLGVWPSLFHRVASRSILRSHSSNAVGFGCAPGCRQRYCHQIKRFRALLRRKTSQPTSLRVELGIPRNKNASGSLENVRWKFGSALEAIRQEWARSSKEMVSTVSPALLVKFAIFVDISASQLKYCIGI